VPVMPSCLALILCKAAVHHRDTGKWDLLGASWEFQMPAFPGNTEPFTIWVALLNGAGRAPMRLRIEHLPDRLEEDLVVDIRFTMEFTDPRVVRVYRALIDGLTLDGPGHYRVALTAHGDALVQGYFSARQTPPPS